jgi:hypothetical protein
MLSVTEDEKHVEDCCKRVSVILIYSLLFFLAYFEMRRKFKLQERCLIK